MLNELATEQVLLLEHLLRVNKDEQPLFNSFMLRKDQLRRCNAALWGFRSMEKFKTLYQLTELLKASPVSDIVLYTLLEKMTFLFAKGPQNADTQILDPRVLTMALIDLLIRVCRVISSDGVETNVRRSLRKSILATIQTQFTNVYVKLFWGEIDG
ncbi:LADA_0F02828g1_1 [Lachancea dasiensis]|uniref:LADA_0F02828g1_1 n=1 Tax=Lachancea dasiensis TaxID=1072105 RepID=A0A1G4JJB6_9SACH|nr:LADA_0F02828g1_1 [Lachancea dasiensis]